MPDSESHVKLNKNQTHTGFNYSIAGRRSTTSSNINAGTSKYRNYEPEIRVCDDDEVKDASMTATSRRLTANIDE